MFTFQEQMLFILFLQEGISNLWYIEIETILFTLILLVFIFIISMK